VSETTRKTKSTASAPGEIETDHPDHEADLKTSALHSLPHDALFHHAQRVGAARLRRLAVSVLLMGLAFALVVVTPLRQAVWSLVAPIPSATATISAKFSPTDVPTSDWDALRARPLHFPVLVAGAPCPVSPAHSFDPTFGLGLGSGPVYPFGFTGDSQPGAYDPPHQTANGVIPGFTKLEWAVASAYGGAALVRGAQLDGHHPVAFNGGYVQRGYQGEWSDAPLLTELHLVGFPGGSGGWTGYGSYVRLEAPGCYAFQVDGSAFSYILTFRAGI
jgi:hypothetical protein